MWMVLIKYTLQSSKRLHECCLYQVRDESNTVRQQIANVAMKKQRESDRVSELTIRYLRRRPSRNFPIRLHTINYAHHEQAKLGSAVSVIIIDCMLLVESSYQSGK